MTKPPLVVSQIATRLREIFKASIDLSDVDEKSDVEKEQFFNTRAYMALFLVDEFGISPKSAAAAITDNTNDDGIDLVYIDKQNDKLYFGQSKWFKNTKKGLSLPDINRFRDGVKSVLELDWHSGNSSLHRFKSDIESMLNKIETSVVLVVAHNSEEKLSKHINRSIEKFCNESNKYNSDFVRFQEFSIKDAARAARSLTRPENINVKIMLRNWGQLAKPYKSVYGAANGKDVVTWYETHKEKLFSENLRYVIEKSDINTAITQTAQFEPDNFWYYNNGITAICDDVEKVPAGNHDASVFEISKISVINGAQTIGALYRAKSAGADVETLNVHIRIISLADTPEGFALAVTNANNTQNDLNPVDFVAMDPNQERIRKEAETFGVKYTFRRGDTPASQDSFDIRSATIASACASGDLKLAVSAKRYISGLWENTRKEPYTKLFNDKVSAIYLWNIVRIMNSVDRALTHEAGKLTKRAKLIAVHANRFILYFVFNYIGASSMKDPIQFKKALENAPKLAQSCLKNIVLFLNKNYVDSYPGNIFKNQDRQEEILDFLDDNFV